MLKFISKFIFNENNKNKKIIEKCQETIKKTKQYESNLLSLSDSELKKQVQDYLLKLKGLDTHDKIMQPLNKNNEKEKMDDIAYCFALIKETSDRILKLRPYDVQMIGAMILLSNSIAEMKTGEGKTLVSAIAAIYQAIHNKKTFVLTVNEYLSKRDYESLKPLYDYWGLTSSYNEKNINENDKNEVDYDLKTKCYQSDIIYSTSRELCFDYLKINTIKDKKDLFFDTEKMNHDFFVIIDEVDSILIDNAKSPFILSGVIEANVNDIQFARTIAIDVLKPSLIDFEHVEYDQRVAEAMGYDFKQEGDFYYNKSEKKIDFFESAYEKIEQYLIDNKFLLRTNDLYSENAQLLKMVENAIHAEYGYIRDVDYLIKDNKAIIIDRNTGRLHMTGRWTEGIHQAVECKENIPIQAEDRVLAQITFQNFFNLFSLKSGMTGTAYTEKEELASIYGLNVVIVPPNKKMQRIDKPDLMFVKESEKYEYLKNLIAKKHQAGQPLLIGTPSVKISEKVEVLLKELELQYEILNAKNHEREAQIIANAGRLNAITISTNMAGRGTDIILGGVLKDNRTEEEWEKERNEVISKGGLCVIGVDKNESRRIDNQLIGRAGRQGEVGESVFIVSLEDDLIKDNLKKSVYDLFLNTLNKLNPDPKEPLPNQSGLSNIVAQAQQAVESYGFVTRKAALKFDNVLNQQRTAIYGQRKKILISNADEIKNIIDDYFQDYVRHQLSKSKYIDFVNMESLELLTQDNLVNIFNELIGQYETYTEKHILENIQADLEKKKNELNNSILNNTSNIKELITNCKDILVWIYNQRWHSIKIMEGQESQQNFERATILNAFDENWSSILQELTSVRKASQLSIYAQKNPLYEYQKQAFNLFKDVMLNIPVQVVTDISKVNMDINLLDLSKLNDYQFPKDISEMTLEELEIELRNITSQLMKTDLHNIYHELNSNEDNKRQ